ncbi:uncharacterized protein LOC111115396 isoform X2 [Crassostrea virginica]
MKSYLAIAFVVSLAVMQVTSQGFNDLQQLLTLKTMGMDLPDSLLNFHLFRGMASPYQRSRTSQPFPSFGSFNSQASNFRQPSTKTVNLEPTTAPDSIPKRSPSTGFSSVFSNLSPMQPTNTNTAYQGINPFLLAMMDFV